MKYVIVQFFFSNRALAAAEQNVAVVIDSVHEDGNKKMSKLCLKDMFTHQCVSGKKPTTTFIVYGKTLGYPFHMS